MLLIGDENLSKVKSSDLGRGCSIRTINDADIHVFRSWISRKLNWKPSECIFYGCLADIKDSLSPSDILDNLTLLISDIRTVNPDIMITICKLAPVVSSQEDQAKVNEFNDELEKWGQCNNIKVISTNLPFQLANGDIDDICYEMEGPNSGFCLNRLGAIRLLDSIAKLCPNLTLCEEWSKIRRHHNWTNNDNDFNKKNRVSEYNQFRHRTYVHNQRLPSNHEPIYARQTNSRYRPDMNRNMESNQPSRVLNNNNRYGTGYEPRNFNTRKRGCYKCGEFNHHSGTCRYDHQIRCASCSTLGHKSRLCDIYSTY